MNKILLRLIAVLLFYPFPALLSSVSFASDTTYTIHQNGPYSPVPGSGTSVSLSNDEISGALPIGFTFRFFGKNYTDFYISSNGFISFSDNGENGCCSGQLLPDVSAPNNLIAFAWEDLNPQEEGHIEYFTTGAPGKKKLVINFVDIAHYNNIGTLISAQHPVTSQIVLNEESGVIEIYTENMTSDGGQHTMGIENEEGTFGYTVSGRNAADWSANEDVVLFIPSSSNKNDVGATSLNLLNPFCNSTEPVIATITNFGTNTVDSLTINWKFNGVTQSPVHYHTPLDSSTGNNPAAQVTLGTKTFAVNKTDTIMVWTSNPNGVQDSVNYNDTLYALVARSFPGGTYTIGGTNPDYASFSDAVSAISKNGICGSVVFKVRNGTYTEQVSIPQITGTAENSTITFESESGDSSAVTLSFSGTNADNYTLQLNGVDYLTFRKMTIAALDADYGNVIDIRNNSNHNNISNCIVQGLTNSSQIIYFGESNSEFNSFRNNRIINGSYGIYYYGNSGSEPVKGIVIENNSFENQYYIALYCYYQDSLVIRRNTISTNSPYDYFYAIYCETCNNQLKIERNKLNLPNGGYGIFLSSCLGTNSYQGIIANNFIQIGGANNAYGLSLNYSEYQKLYNNNIHITNSQYGTGVYISGGGGDGAIASGISHSSSATAADHTIDIVNNILANTGGGYALLTYEPQLINTSDYNDLYTTGATLAYWSGEHATLSDLQTASGKDVHSISKDPLFESLTDLHVHEIDLNGAGTPLAEITNDIDGEPRNTLQPDIGADEFTPPLNDAGIYSLQSPRVPFSAGTKDIIVSLKNFGADTLETVAIDWTIDDIEQTRINWSGSLLSGDTVFVKLGTYAFNAGTSHSIKSWSVLPNGNPDLINTNDTIQVDNLYPSLSGIYTIGGVSPDFQSFQGAVTALKQSGIAGNVVFKVRNGTYTEQISIPAILGTSANSTVTFESESGDSATVLLSSAANNTNNYTLQLNGADYFIFRNMSMAALNNSYGRVMDIRNGSTHNTIANCILQGNAISSTSQNLSIVYSNGSKDEFNGFRNNRIINGSFGFYYWGESTFSLEKGTLIENNSFENQYYQALYCYYQDSLTIRGNTIKTNSVYTNYYGAYCVYCNNHLTIEKNKLSIPNGGFGIYVNSCQGTNLRSGLIANNFVQIGGTNTAYGIYLYSSNYQKVYHNNVHITSTSTGNGMALFVDYYGANNKIINNIFANSGGGYALYNSYPSSIDSSDYNNLYTTGTKFAYWSADKANLSELQSASGKEAHSISVNPLFKSAVDLHVLEIDLNAAGTPLPEISNDIDGETRNSLKPDIGADEFTPPLSDAGIYTLVSPKMPFPSGSNDVVVALKNHGSDTLKTAAIDWILNGVQQARINWLGNLASGDTAFVKLATYTFNPGTSYAIKTWSLLPNGNPDVVNSNDTIAANNLFPAMAGIYTIGGASPDFVNFQTAVAALTQGGIASNVVFKVRNGIYNEQISIPAIIGASKNSTIVFESESSDSSQVNLTFTASSTNNYTVQFNGADHVTFQKMTLSSAPNYYYARVIDISNSSSYNTVANCVLLGSTYIYYDYTAVIYSNSYKDSYNSFRNNRILNGGYGLYYYGLSGSELEKGTVIENNSFENQYYQGVYCQYQDSLIIRNNTINTNLTNTGYYPVYCGSCNNQLVIEKNKLYAPTGGYGIYLNSCQGTNLSPGLISNNFIQVGGTSTAYGIYLYYSAYHKVYNNNIHVTGTSVTSGMAINLYYGSNNSLVNNILVNSGGGFVLYTVSPSSIITSDYNDLFTTGAKLAYWSGDRATLSDLKLASGKDIHSISVNPLYKSATDLHVREIVLNKAGTPLAEVKYDIDGEPRDSLKPDIGADEFNPALTDAGIYSLEGPKAPFPSGNNNVIVALKNHGADTLKTVAIDWTVNGDQQVRINWTGSLVSGDTINVNLGSYLFNPLTSYNIKSWTTLPNGVADVTNVNDTIRVNNLFAGLIGVYTIGGSSPDFTDFHAADTALNRAGVLGNVVFKIRNGNYNEQISIAEIKGVNKNATVTFESESGDSTKVNLMFTANNLKNYTLQLNGADYFTFRKMTITALNNSYGNVIDIRNKSHHTTFSNCLVQGITNSSYAVYSTNASKDDYTTFRNNRILNSSYGFYFEASSSDSEKGTVIENNSFENQYYQALYCYYQDSLTIRGNTVKTNSAYTSHYAVNCTGCRNQLRIEKNKLHATNGGYGIYLNSCIGTSSYPGVIANNFIQTGGTSTGYGIYLNSSAYQKIYNNNIHITNTSATNGSAMYIGYSNYYGTIDIVNNIFANTGGGYAVNNQYPNTINVSDYNDLYATGTRLAYWSGDRATLSDLKTASGKEVHSVSQNPLFQSATDLHVREIILNQGGTPFALVVDDIDGETRDSLKPDIGADEFTPPLSDAGIYSLEKPTTPFPAGNNTVIVALKNNGGDTLKTAGIDWTVNGILQTKINWTGSLASGDTVHVPLGTYNFNAATLYTIKSWTNLPNGNPDANGTNDTVRVNNLLPGLIGVYTIGGTSPDFVNFNTADTALKRAGVLGNVIFKVRNGTYTEQVSLVEAKGAGKNATITFESESGDSTKVILRFGANNTRNYTVQLNGADYFAFRKMTISATNSSYGNVIDIRNSSNQNTFSNCVLQGITNSSEVVFSDNSDDEFNSFKNNRIVNGSYGIYYYGISTSALEKGTVIENNSFENQYYRALDCYYQDSLTIRGNTFKTNSVYTSYYAMYNVYCNNQLTIEKNKLYIPNGGFGIYLNSCQGNNLVPSLIANNFVQIGGTSTAYGIYLYSSTYQKVYHNNVHITSTSAGNGMALFVDYYGTNNNIINNIFANSGGGYALYNSYPSSVATSDYNDLYTTGTKLAYWSGDRANLNELQTASGKEAHSLSVNPLYVSATDLHVREVILNAAGTPLALVTTDIDGQQRDLNSPDIGADEFIVGTANDAGIASINHPKTPFSPGNQNVYVTLKNSGADTLRNATISWQVNNISQSPFLWTGSIAPAESDSISIGLYNFQVSLAYSIKAWSENPNGFADTVNYNDTATVNNLYAALSGIYTIGGTSPDFPTFSQAVSRLSLAGVAGQVTFNVRPGSYKTQLSLGQIKGASASNTIVFQSENGDSTGVVLKDSVTTYVIQLDGTDYITFQRLTIRNAHPNYGKVIEMKNGANYNKVLNSILQGVSSTNNYWESAVILSSNSTDSYNEFRNNSISKGSYGILLEGLDNSNMQVGNTIANNIFNDQSNYGIYLYYQDGPVITKNSIRSNSSVVSLYGCYVNNSKGSLEITKNKIALANDGYGLYCGNFTGTSSAQGLIANNFISVGGTLTANGFNLGYNSYLNVYNNNTSIRNTAPSATALYYANGANNNLVNNIFSNSGGGYAVTISNLNTIKTLDYNDLYTTGSFLVHYNNNQYANLTAWKQVSNMDFHSLSMDPLFVSADDLHVSQIGLDSAGVPVALITDDIDGNPRNANFPDIGADEFENNKHDVGITEILPSSACMLTNNESVIVTIRNFGAFTETGFQVAYSIDNSPPVIETVNQSIPAGGTLKHTFSTKANLSVIRNYSFTAYSSLTSDENSSNDTTVSNVANMPKLNIQLTGNTLICPGTSLLLAASGADKYKWNTGATTNAIYVNPYYTTTYTVTATNIFNCQDVKTVTVNVNPIPPVPVITPAGPTTFCNGSSQVLTSSINHHIVWSTGEKTPSITVSNGGYYTVRYTDSLGCSATSTAVHLIEEAAPVITPHNISVCSNDTIVLSVNNAVSFLWSTGANTPSIKIVPGTSATYSVSATTAHGCTFVLSSTITILPTKTPAQVTGMVPANGAVDLSLPLDVSWLPAENATRYDVFVWPADQPKPAQPFASNINSIRHTFYPGTLTYGTTYKWQVISKYHSCESTQGPVQTFMLRHLPDLVINNVQIPSSAYTGQNIDITWEVKNQGLGNTVHQQWTDQLYMSIDTVNDEFYSLGRVSNMTYLEPGQSYSKQASFTLPKFKDGLFNIFSWADRDNKLLETNNNNNQGRSANPLWIKLTPPPDLYVSAIVPPSDFFSEDTINVSWTVINKGNWQTETNTWTDRVYISQDFNNAQRYIIGTFTHVGDTLYPGQSYSTTKPVIIPEAIFGRYYIYVETDLTNRVYEHAYDGNNVSQSDSVNVILRPPADMMVDNIVIPQSVTNIQSANIQWRVTNIGNSSPNDKNWTDGIYLTKSATYDLSNAYFFPFYRSKPTGGIPLDLTYNNSENIKIPNFIPPGDYYVYVKTDAGEQIFEYLFEQNNLLRSDTTMKIVVAPWPDLQVTAFSFPDSAGATETIPVNFTVTNKGTASATGEWTDKIYISNYYNCPGRIMVKDVKRNIPLLPDSSYTVSTTAILPTGFQLGSNRYCFSAYADANANLYEHTSETNNERIDTIFIKPSDLAVTTNDIPVDAYTGTVISVKWTIENEGGASSPAVFWRDLVELVDSTFSPVTDFNKNVYWKYGPVKQATSYTNQHGLLIPEGIKGNYYVRLTTDIYNENREKITTNNVKLIPIKILLRQPTDLVVSSFNLPANGIAGQPVTMQWNVQNTGPGATLAQGWSDRIYLSEDTVIDGNDIMLGSYNRSGGLASGGSYTRSEQIFLPISAVGNYQVIVMTDFTTVYNPYGQEYEHEAEDNNTSSSLMTITLAPPSDLIVTQITAPASATTGEPVTIGWTVKNLGPNKAEGYLTDMVYFSKDSAWDIDDPFFGENPVHITLQPNEEKTFSLTTELNGTAVGDYHVLVRTDNKNNIYETNNLNNTLASSKVNVEVALLPLYVLKQKTLQNSKGVYYRVEIPDSLVDETLLITLKGDSVLGDNELYISYDSVPSRSNSDYASTGKPFYGNQEVIVPSLIKGRYYLLVYGNVSVGTTQDITLYAQIINFQVRSVKANEGGNKGKITVEVGGARFTSDMKLQLQDSAKVTTIVADSLIFVDATKVFVTFNLMDAPLGFYDVVAIKTNGDTTSLKKGFKVVPNSPFSLVTSVKAPAAMRLGTIAIISVQFANDGNVDVPTPTFKLISEDGLPISFLKKDLVNGETELEFECHEVNGPQNVLRPGAIGTVYIWVQATRTGLTHFRFE